MSLSIQIPDKTSRRFLPFDFQIESWESLAPYYEQLLAEEINSAEEMEAWFLKVDELESTVYEDFAWRKILMSCDTADPELNANFQAFLREIMPHLAPVSHKIQLKLYNCPHLSDLDQEKYQTLIRRVKNSIELYHEKNIALDTEIRSIAQEYYSKIGGMTISHHGQEFTMQKAASFLEERDRALREEIFRKISARRMEDSESLNEIFSKLVSLRAEVGANAGFSSYTDYAFRELGRFDYAQEDCDQFRNSIEKVVKPLYEGFLEERREKLSVKKLYPWDLSVNVLGDEPLRPFDNSTEMYAKTKKVFGMLRPELGDMLDTMEEKGFIDLESRKGKAPGAFSYRLPESDIPFIFMNAVGTQGDLTTIVHEGGHAIHAFLTRGLELNDFKNVPSEVAELASMAMELLVLEHYRVFYENDEDWNRAMREQITRTLTLLPWIATVDAFQKWCYDHPEHTAAQREEEWTDIYRTYHGKKVDWDAIPGDLKTLWHKQVHIFEMPFYYIEYGIAQLGAIAVWRNYKQNPEKGLQQYLDALSLGYTRTIPEVYETAGIKFDFSENYIQELCDFVMEELNQLK